MRGEKRIVKGITDALLGTEEIVGALDAHDRRYAKGLRFGSAVALSIAERKNTRIRRVEAEAVKARIRKAVDA